MNVLHFPGTPLRMERRVVRPGNQKSLLERRVGRARMLRRRSSRRAAGLLDPRVYLKAVIAISLLALVVLPFGADGINAGIGARSVDGCRVLRIVDGDTVTLWCPERGAMRVRLTGFDAPELFSPQCAAEYAWAQVASWHLRRLVFAANELTVRFGGTDPYQRQLAEILLDGMPVSRKMIDAGMARPYSGGARSGWC